MAVRFIDLILRFKSPGVAAEMDALGLKANASAREIQRAYGRVAAFERGRANLARAADSAAMVSARKREARFNRTTKAIRTTGTVASTAGTAVTRMGFGLGAIGYYSVKSATDFQSAMTRIHTLAQVSSGDVDRLSKSVLNLGSSGKTQFGPTQLAEALYHIQSVAVGNTIPGLDKTTPVAMRLANAMGVLKVASEGAAIGGTNLSDTSTALMGIMISLHAKSSDAANIMQLMDAAVGAGNMTMNDLVGALGRGIIPAFRNVNLTATDALGAIALFADQGTKATSSAAQLGTALHYLVQPSTKADKFIKQIGMGPLTMAQDLNKPNGLLTALKDLKGHIDKYGGLHGLAGEQILYALLPGGRGRILQQAINNLTQYGSKLDAVKNPTVKLQEAALAQAKTMSGQLHTSWATIQADMTKFGGGLIPIISKMLPMFTQALGGIFNAFNSLSKPVKTFIAYTTVAFALGGPLLLGLGAVLSTIAKIRDMWIAVKMRAAEAAVVEEGAGAAGVGGGAAGAAGAAGAKGGGFLGILGALGAYALFKQLSKHHQRQVKHDLGTVINRINPLPAVGAGLNQLLGGHPGSALKAVTGKFPVNIPSMLLQPILGPAAVVGGIASKLFGATGGVVTSSGIQRYQSGGVAGFGTDTVPAMLTPGEGILTRAAMASLGVPGLGHLNSGGNLGEGMTIQPSPAYFMVDGRVLARAVTQYTLQRAARGPSSLVGGALATGVATG